MTGNYGTSRKVGVGFNYDRVLNGSLREDWRKSYRLSRRLVRFHRSHFRFNAIPSSVVAALASDRSELIPRRVR